MDDPAEYLFPGKPSPRREVQLQGPRPAPLRVSKDSYKIGKPPPAPRRAGPSPFQSQQQQRRPVVIYMVSPKVIHIEPGNFMTLVQRLTGASPRTLRAAAAAAGSQPSVAADQTTCSRPGVAAGGHELCPAARFAVMEQETRLFSLAESAAAAGCEDDIAEQLGGGATVERYSGSFPAGILSPVPSARPPIISHSFFSPPEATEGDPRSPAFPNEMSPIFRCNAWNGGTVGGFVDGPFWPSPGYFLSSPSVPSPGTLWEFFNQQ